jgi:vitamin B12 transporter
MKKAIQLSLLSAALLSQLNADNQYTLESIDVTASQGTTLKKKDVTDSVIVITKEDLEESRVTTLDEVLSKLGGIAMTQNGGLGKTTSMFIRGMSTKRTLVLIDGVRYNNPTSSAGAEYSQIMLYNVEQIEIIKGAQSGVWGADASGAVINIVTSKAKKGLHGVTNIEYGSFDTKKASLQASYATDEYDILIGGSLLDTDGFSAAEPKKSEATYGQKYDDLGLEKDKYINQSINTKLGYNITDMDRVELSLQATNGDIDYDKGAGSASDSTIPNTYLQNRFYTLKYKHTGDINQINVSYSLSTFNRDVTGVDWKTGNAATTLYNGSVSELKIDDKITYTKDSFLRIGGSFQQFEDNEIVANTTKDYSAISAFATNYNKLELFSGLNTILTESIRYDSYDNFDNAFTWKLGAKQFVGKGYFISANLGTGYNVPSSYQLYNPTYGNQDLQPEKSFTSDITLGSDTIWITGFYNEITNLIEWAYPAYQQVDGTSKFKGIELGYEDYFFDSLGVNAMYTYVKTEDTNKESLARRPKEQFDAKIVYYVSEEFDLGLSTQYIGERYDRANDKGAQTGKYTVVNFVSNIKVNKFVTVYTKLDNLADKYYQTVDGYSTAGRSLYFGLNTKY